MRSLIVLQLSNTKYNNITLLRKSFPNIFHIFLNFGHWTISDNTFRALSRNCFLTLEYLSVKYQIKSIGFYFNTVFSGESLRTSRPYHKFTFRSTKQVLLLRAVLTLLLLTHAFSQHTVYLWQVVLLVHLATTVPRHALVQMVTAIQKTAPVLVILVTMVAAVQDLVLQDCLVPDVRRGVIVQTTPVVII